MKATVTTVSWETSLVLGILKDQTVPAHLPYAVPWEQLERKMKVPASAKRIRGKLNTPRERFRVTASGEYVWAGKTGAGD